MPEQYSRLIANSTYLLLGNVLLDPLCAALTCFLPVASIEQQSFLHNGLGVQVSILFHILVLFL